MSDDLHLRPLTDPSADPRDLLSAAARDFYRRGWMAGTAGNLSLRLADGSFWITASGKPKGSLSRLDFLRVAPDGTVLARGREGDRPSAETSLHGALYGLFPESRACFHVHTVAATVASRLAIGDDLPLPPIEMIKGFGLFEENPRVSMPVLANHASVPRIAADLGRRFAAVPPAVPGFLIRDHGLTVWAEAPEGAVRYLELFEFLFGCLLAAPAANVRW